MVAMVVSCQDDTKLVLKLQRAGQRPWPPNQEVYSKEKSTTCNLTQLSHYPYENLHKKDNNNNERYVIWL